MPARFVPLADVAETLSISAAQAYALVRRGDLRAIQVGGRGQWRVEISELDAYIDRMYAEASRYGRDEERSDPDHAADQNFEVGQNDAVATSVGTTRRSTATNHE